ncbi:MAG: alpha/beta hydrolase [Bacteroidota bacterium]
MLKRILLAVLVLLGLVVFSVYYSDISREVLWERYAYPDSKTVEIDGMPVHYRVAGDGAPVVLIHGTGSSLHTWEGWINDLQDRFQFIAVDLPAFGLTGPHPKRDYSIAAYVDFVESFVAAIEVDSFALAGNSLGGLIAWAYTAQYPERVTSLALLDPSGFPGKNAGSEAPPLPMRLAQQPITAKVMQRITPKFIIKNSLLEVYSDDSKVSQKLVDRYFEMSLREGNRQAFVDRSNTVRNVDTLDLMKIAVPTMIMWGEEDLWIPVGDAARFAHLLANDTTVILPNIGHVPMEEAPGLTAEIFGSWLLEQQQVAPDSTAALN